jgi:3-methyladenine DNA glycosylase AlkD
VRYAEVLEKLKSLCDPQAVAAMTGYGINADNAFGIPIPRLRKIAKEIGKDHALSEQLWSSGIHEAKIVASMIADPQMVTEQELERWVEDFDSWDVCDQCCNNLFYKTNFAYQKAMEWSLRREEFVKRAGFVLMACLAVHDKGNRTMNAEAIDVATDLKRIDSKPARWIARDALRELSSNKIQKRLAN